MINDIWDVLVILFIVGITYMNILALINLVQLDKYLKETNSLLDKILYKLYEIEDGK